MDEKQERITPQRVETVDAADAKPKEKGRFWSSLIWGTLYALWGYLLGGALLPFGAKPLGFALLGGTDRRIFYVFIGLCFASWQSPDRIVLIAIYTAVLLVRLLVRFVLDTPWEEEDGAQMGERTVAEVYPMLFSEHVGLRMATTCVSVFAFSVYRLVQGGFLYYDLYGLILSVVLAPAAVLLFYGVFHSEEVTVGQRMLGVLSLGFAILWSTGEMKLYGISLAALGCMLLTLYITRSQGVVMGLLTGTVCGLAVSVELAPLFAFAALAYGLLLPISRGFATVSALVAGVAWGCYVSGLSVLNGLLSALLVSVVLFSVWDKLFSENEVVAESAEAASPIVCLPLDQGAINGIRLSETKERLKVLCESFSSLSSVFLELSGQMKRPSVPDLRQICDRAFEASCASCSLQAQCWGEQYRTTSAEVGALTSALHQNGRVERGDAESSLVSRCSRLPDILEEINHNAALYQRQAALEDRTEVFALDYAALSELLAASMVEEEGAMCDEAASAVLCNALSSLKLSLTGACVRSGRRRSVYLCAKDPSVFQAHREQIVAVVREACPFEVDEGVISEDGEEHMIFLERERLSVCCAKRTLCADGEERYCGDTVGAFRNSDGRFFALISDGMGAGREAALTSAISATFLRKLLDAGASCEMAVKMLNGFLRNRGSGSLHECSSTVDLMELDLMRGRASFYKSGAAPTYVYRDGSLFKLRSRTVPVGILREPDSRKIGFDVGCGDVIVMVSDGVTQGKEECPRLFDLLRSHGEEASPERLADLILKYAKEDGATDDLSVLVVKIA